MAIDPNEDYRQAEAILFGRMEERNATPAARQLALRRMNQPLRYPDKPRSLGGEQRPLGPTPVGAASLSGGMVGAPSAQMSPDDELMERVTGDQLADELTVSRDEQENGPFPQNARSPRFRAQEKIRNRQENPPQRPGDPDLDERIYQGNVRAGQAGPADRPGTVGQNNPRIAMGQITDEDRQSQREWEGFVNAEPGSEMQQRFNKPGYDAYWAERTEDNRRSAGRQRFARQQELDNMSPEEYEAMLQKGRESMAERKLRIRNREVSLRTRKTLAEVAAMKTPAEKEDAMSDARDLEARGRADSYRFQAQLGGGTVNRETSRIDALLSRLSPEARDRAMVQMLSGRGMGPNEVEAAGLQLNARNQIGGGLGQGGAANNPLVQAQAAGANQQNAQNAQGQRVINENSIIGDHYAQPGMFGWDTFDEREQNQAVQDLINNQNYTPAQAADAVRRIARERRSKVHI